MLYKCTRTYVDNISMYSFCTCFTIFFKILNHRTIYFWLIFFKFFFLLARSWSFPKLLSFASCIISSGWIVLWYYFFFSFLLCLWCEVLCFSSSSVLSLDLYNFLLFVYLWVSLIHYCKLYVPYRTVPYRTVPYSLSTCFCCKEFGVIRKKDQWRVLNNTYDFFFAIFVQQNPLENVFVVLHVSTIIIIIITIVNFVVVIIIVIIIINIL